MLIRTQFSKEKLLSTLLHALRSVHIWLHPYFFVNFFHVKKTTKSVIETIIVENFPSEKVTVLRFTDKNSQHVKGTFSIPFKA